MPFCFRTLLRNFSATLVIVVTLGVAIGASTIIFSVIDTTWHVIPVKKRERLVFVASTDPRRGQAQAGVSGGVARAGVSIPDLVDWSEQTRTFEHFAGFTFGTATLTGIDLPARVSILNITSNLLEVWGIQPVLGRDFQSDDGNPGAERVALVTERFWQRQFSRDPATVGRSFLLNGIGYTIVGVLPPDAGRGIFGQTDLFIPIVIDRLNTPRDRRNLFVTGVLKAGVSRQQAADDLSAIARRLQTEHPQTNTNIGAVVRPLLELAGANSPAVLILLSLMAMLLVAIAASNVSNIMLAQLAARRREFAVRSALGAGRSHHIRQLMTEGMVYSSLAALLGIFLAFLGVSALVFIAGDRIAFREIALNSRVLAAGVLLAFAAPLGFALIPALRSSAPDPEELKAGNRSAGSTRGRRLRQAFVAIQVALALVLMVQIGLIVRTTWSLHDQDPGFDPANLLTFRVELDRAKYTEPVVIRQFFEQFLARLQTLPDVVSAGATDSLPISDRERNVPFTVQGTVPRPQDSKPWMAASAISENYLRTMRIPIRRGRDLTSVDFNGAVPVALINEEAARLYWPSEDAIGRRIAFESFATPDVWFEIVGVVRNIRNSNADNGPAPQVYVPNSWHVASALAIIARTSTTDPLQLVATIREEVSRMDEELPIYEAATMQQVLFDDLFGTYLLAGVLASIAMVAFCLAAAGIYGVVRYSVSQRVQEICIRMALGANASSILIMVIAQGYVPVTIGVFLGLIGALTLTNFTSAAISEVGANDPLIYVAVLGAVCFVAFLATYVPARRATRVDAVKGLRAV